MDGFVYSTQTAEGFEEVYYLGHDVATEIYRAELQQRFAPQLPAALVVDAEPISPLVRDEENQP